jgi:2-polyprenyl-3-methyl-5-hydroxy-6-metoxy-1,4-benzoquinol methylase
MTSYRDTPPWEIGEPQPALLELLDEYLPAGPVLDAGCGTGELTTAQARRGLTALSVDLAEAAIARARAKAAAVAPEIGRLVTFRVGDALHPSLLPGPFGAVINSGFSIEI